MGLRGSPWVLEYPYCHQVMAWSPPQGRNEVLGENHKSQNSSPGRQGTAKREGAQSLEEGGSTVTRRGKEHSHSKREGAQSLEEGGSTVSAGTAHGAPPIGPGFRTLWGETTPDTQY